MRLAAFGEGVLDQSCDGLNMTQLGNGFELLRQLTMEYSLRTRAEAFIRRLDLESARFNKLLSTLPASVDAVGLQLSDADLLAHLGRC